MRFDRRHFAIAGALTLGAAGVLHATPAAAQADDAAVAQAAEALRKAMLDADRAKLTDLTADQLSYGHSSNRIETKAQFIDVVAGKKTTYKSITLSDPTVAVVGSNAIVRHVFAAETEADGKPGSSRVGALQVWQKQNGSWKLLARQAFKL
jgi:hypothetical protein